MAEQITTIPLSEIRALPQVRSEHNQGFKLYLNKDEKIDLAVSSTTNVTLTPDEDTVSYLNIIKIG